MIALNLTLRANILHYVQILIVMCSERHSASRRKEIVSLTRFQILAGLELFNTYIACTYCKSKSNTQNWFKSAELLLLKQAKLSIKFLSFWESSCTHFQRYACMSHDHPSKFENCFKFEFVHTFLTTHSNLDTYLYSNLNWLIDIILQIKIILQLQHGNSNPTSQSCSSLNSISISNSISTLNWKPN